MRWYYTVSPRIAAVMNDHPVLKPLVRALLAPFVLFAEAANSPVLLAALFIVGCGLVLILVRSRRKLGDPAR